MKMTWDEFVSNVRVWATERGIYEHSTAVAQALKACSEAGELCDAVIKGDREAMIDACGDVAVCLVNVAALHNCTLEMDTESFDECFSIEHAASRVSVFCGRAAETLAVGELSDAEIQEALYCLDDFCFFAGLNLLECCESAWEVIRHRRGKMVAGGAFVKEEA